MYKRQQESSLLEIVKLIGSDVLPDDQKLVLEIARVIRLGFLQQNAFHPDDTCVSMEKQFLMMDTILYPVSYTHLREIISMQVILSQKFLKHMRSLINVWFLLK